MPQFGNVVTVASYKCCNKKIRNNLSHTVALIPNKIRVLRNILYFMRNLNTYTAPRAKTCDSSPFSDWDWFSLGFFGGGLRYCPLLGQYASRFGYLPAANTPHIGLRYCPLPGQYASRLASLLPLAGAIRFAVRLFACGKYASHRLREGAANPTPGDGAGQFWRGGADRPEERSCFPLP